MKFLITLYTYAKPGGRGNPPPEMYEIDAATGTEAVRVVNAELRRRAHSIKVHASHVVGWTEEDKERRKAAILHQIAWLHGTVEGIR